MAICPAQHILSVTVGNGGYIRLYGGLPVQSSNLCVIEGCSSVIVCPYSPNKWVIEWRLCSCVSPRSYELTRKDRLCQNVQRMQQSKVSSWKRCTGNGRIVLQFSLDVVDLKVVHSSCWDPCRAWNTSTLFQSPLSSQKIWSSSSVSLSPL